MTSFALVLGAGSVRVDAHEPKPARASAAAAKRAAPDAVPASKRGADAAVVGTWTYQDGDAGRERVEEAIREATESLDPLSQKIARERLEETLAPAARISVDISSPQVEVDLGHGPVIRGELGEWTKWRSEGETYRVYHHASDDKLIQKMRSDRTKVRRSFDASGSGLTLSVRVDDDRLGDVVRFSLGYGK